MLLHAGGESHGSKLGEDFREKMRHIPSKKIFTEIHRTPNHRKVRETSETTRGKIIKGGRERKFTEAYRSSPELQQQSNNKENVQHNRKRRGLSR